MSAVLVGPDLGDRGITSCDRDSDWVANTWAGDPVAKSCSLPLEKRECALIDSENPCEENELTGSASWIGCGLTSRPGFSPSVPSMKSEFLGLMQYSSTLILLLVTTPWRDRKLCTLGGAGSFVVKKESQNSSWKSRCRSRSAPRGSINTRPVLSSTKKGRCMHSPATLTQFLFLPCCLYSQTSVR